MKKILFCAGLVALATSCTQDETISLDVQNEKGKGITFEVVDQLDARIQYDKEMVGERETYKPFWYAEQDRISIWANGVIKNPYAEDLADRDTIAGTYWTGLKGDSDKKAIATFKATSSTKEAKFTAVSDANILGFHKADKQGAKFLAIYPANEDYELTPESNGGTNEVVDTFTVTGLLTGLDNQKIETAKGWNKGIVMLAGAAESQDEVYESTGEKMPLQFSYATPILKLGTKGLTKDFQEEFGNLKKITIKTHGIAGETAGTYKVKPSPLHYDTNAALQITDTLNWKGEMVYTGNSILDSTTVNSITVTIGGADGLAWDDDAIAPVAVAPAKRAIYGTTGEIITADYQFENITIQEKKTGVTADFEAGANFKGITLDITKQKHLVTNANAQGKRTLFVNSGDFSEILYTKQNTSTNQLDSLGVIWPAELSGYVAFTSIDKIIVAEAVTLDEADFKVMNKMVEATVLTMNGQTTIPAESMKDMVDLVEINLPKVTSVGVGAFDADFTTVNMPAYQFNQAANACLLPNTIVKLNMGALGMNTTFPASGLTLQGYTALEEVTVKDSIVLGSNAFAGCTSLEKVIGAVVLDGVGVFQNCTSLDSVVVKSKDVKANAFDGCSALKDVFYNAIGTALVPNKINDFAFKGTQVNLDLSQTTAIGDSAFHSVTTLVGDKYSTENPVLVVKVGATSIGNGAFKNTIMEYVEFTGATSVGDKVFEGNSSLEEIKFVNAFTYSGTEKPSTKTFGDNPEDITLYVNSNQTGVGTDDKTLTFGPTNKTVNIKFNEIK